MRGNQNCIMLICLVVVLLKETILLANGNDTANLFLSSHDREPGLHDSTDQAGIYYYHANPAGNTTHITDGSGEVYQHLEYFPFGETFVDECAGDTGNDRMLYQFNAKEKDDETGLYYYGARYYDPSANEWLSIDPMADKYPGWSPYNHTLDNPLKYTDPDGRDAKYIVVGTRRVEKSPRFENGRYVFRFGAMEYGDGNVDLKVNWHINKEPSLWGGSNVDVIGFVTINISGDIPAPDIKALSDFINQQSPVSFGSRLDELIEGERKAQGEDFQPGRPFYENAERNLNASVEFEFLPNSDLNQFTQMLRKYHVFRPPPIEGEPTPSLPTPPVPSKKTLIPSPVHRQKHRRPVKTDGFIIDRHVLQEWDRRIGCRGGR